MKVFTKIISILLIMSTILLVNATINFILIYYAVDTREYSYIVVPFQFTAGSKYHKQFSLEKEGTYRLLFRFHKFMNDDIGNKSIRNYLINHPSNYSSWPFIIILLEDNSVLLNSDSLFSPGYGVTKEWLEKDIGHFEGKTGSKYTLNMLIKAPILELSKTKCEIVVCVSSRELVDRGWKDYADKMISAIVLLYLLGIFHIIFLLRVILVYKKWISKMIHKYLLEHSYGDNSLLDSKKGCTTVQP